MKVLIVDDEYAIVNLIRMNLRLDGCDTICAYSGQEAIELYSIHAPDIVLLDIMLPDMDGYDVLKAIEEIDKTVAVIFITADDKRTSKILGLELGADDYITKPFDNKELVLRVKTLWRRINIASGKFDPERQEKKRRDILTHGGIQVDEGGRRVWADQQSVALTYHEFDLLCYMLHHRDRVLGREELLEKIWGYNYMGNTRTVDVMVMRLRDKLGAYGGYIKTIYGVGYKIDWVQP